jgi:hypothetical protein
VTSLGFILPLVSSMHSSMAIMCLFNLLWSGSYLIWSDFLN